MACCRTYYACKDCHEELAGHALAAWPPGQRDELAVRCGVCAHEMSINGYLECGSICPSCSAAFNPRCSNHHHVYFAS